MKMCRFVQWKWIYGENRIYFVLVVAVLVAIETLSMRESIYICVSMYVCVCV